MRTDDMICVGHVTSAQGIKGWVKIFSNTDPRENILSYSPWYIEGEGELKESDVKGKRQGQLVIAQIKDCETRNQAEALIGRKIYISPSQLPKLEEDEYYWSDLIGMQVVTLDSVVLGQVKDMMETGADDVMVIEDQNVDKRTHLIPFVLDDLVVQVDREQKRIVVDWQEDF